MIRASSVAVIVIALLACKSPSELRVSGAERDQQIEVSGRVTVAGAAPQVMLVLVADNAYYELVGYAAKELWNLQQRHVTVRGRLIRQAMGPGSPARIEVEYFTLT